jgi:DNA-directed RNA polymerase subunit RPC12/RpoP
MKVRGCKDVAVIATKTYVIGDQPGNGTYRCCQCGKYVARLLSPEEQLPPCENCGSNEHVRYKAEDREAKQSHGPK